MSRWPVRLADLVPPATPVKDAPTPPPPPVAGHPHRGCRCVDCRMGEMMARAVIQLVDEKATLEAELVGLREQLARQTPIHDAAVRFAIARGRYRDVEPFTVESYEVERAVEKAEDDILNAVSASVWRALPVPAPPEAPLLADLDRLLAPRPALAAGFLWLEDVWAAPRPVPAPPEATDECGDARGGWVCDLPVGHEGQHLAEDEGTIAHWPNTPAPPEAPKCSTCNGDGFCRGAYDVIVGECGDCDGTGAAPPTEDEAP